MRLSKWIKAVIILALVTYPQVASASWYTGNWRPNSTGVKATIATPSVAPYLASSGESSWVSTPGPYWVQAGWRFYLGWPAARRYVEHNVSGNYGLTHYGDQSWGTSVQYQVSYDGGNNWGGYISGIGKGSWGPITSPQNALAKSEVHDNSNNQLNTYFSGVNYRTTNNIWFLFDQANWIEDAPYQVIKYNNYTYTNYRP